MNGDRVMKITNNVALDFLPIFISLNQLFETIYKEGSIGDSKKRS